MYDPFTIDVAQAYRRSLNGKATLVCAYADADKCRSMLLQGALTFAEFLERRSTLPWDREIIFYCAGAHEETSTQRVEQFAGEFLSRRALHGGVNAWREGGYPMAAEAEHVRAMP